MKKNPPKKQLALEEYIVGGLRYRKVLLKVSKRFGIKGVQAWGMTETSP
jgi:fatty-acyl-CoA synthase